MSGAGKGAKPPARGGKAAPSRQRRQKEEELEVVPEELTIVPADQVKLTAKQLDDDVTRVVTATNPQAPQGLVMFNFPDREYRVVPGAADEHVLLQVRKNAYRLYVDSEELLEQKAHEKAFKDTVDQRRRARLIAAQAEGKDLSAAELEEDDTQRNQFNFTERSMQMLAVLTKSRVVSTVPPENANAHGSMTQWALYDAYMQEFERLQYMMTMEKALPGKAKKGEEEAPKNNSEKIEDPLHTKEVGVKLGLVSRIINQVRMGWEGGCCVKKGR